MTQPSKAQGAPNAPVFARVRALVAAEVRRLTPLEKRAYPLVAAWVLAMIAVPIVNWTLSAETLPAAITLGVGFQVCAVIVILAGAWGLPRALGVTLGVMVLAWSIEYVGHMTGFPFGAYDYTARLQPQIGGVPILIPLAWMMMMPSAWVVARGILGEPRTLAQKAAFVAVSALAFTAWDLFLDPQMVNWDLWRWDDPGTFHYFGIPLINYAGWLLSSSLMTSVMLAFAPRLSALPARPLLLVYAVTWILQTIGLLVFWGLPGPALVGFLGMGAMLALAVHRERFGQ